VEGLEPGSEEGGREGGREEEEEVRVEFCFWEEAEERREEIKG